MDDPRGLGVALRNPGSGPGTAALWRYQVGDWRIVARIEDEVLRVLVLRTAHRREVYRRSCDVSRVRSFTSDSQATAWPREGSIAVASRCGFGPQHADCVIGNGAVAFGVVVGGPHLELAGPSVEEFGRNGERGGGVAGMEPDVARWRGAGFADDEFLVRHHRFP